MDDTISRQQAISRKVLLEDWTGKEHYAVLVIDIEQLPPIQPKRGKWIQKSYRWECDQCGCLIRRANPFKGNEWNYNFCPNCGADMREDCEVG